LQYINKCAPMHQRPSCAYVYGCFFYSWRLRVLVFALKEVEGFCFYSWRLKVFDFAFKCSIFLLFLLNVEGSCSYFYFLMLKVIALIFGCSKFLLLVLDVESFYFYSWILKVCDSWSFVYLHI